MLHDIITAMAAAVGVLVLCLLLEMRGTVQGIGAETYIYVNNKLQKKKSGPFSYYEIKAFLDKNGASYVIGALAEPVKYLGLCILLFMLGLMVGASVNLAAALLAGAIAAALPGMLILFYNHTYNEKLLGDIRMTYQFIAIQTGAGVYISDALLECRDSVEDKRFHNALAALSNEIAAGYNISGALSVFEESFDNPYIDTLCIIIRQSLESGRSVDLLKDVTEQLKEVEENILYKKQEQLSRKIGLVQILFLTGACTLFLYAFMYSAQGLLINF